MMQAIIYQGKKVITTELLAQAYETDVKNIRMNFKRNQDRFILGRHYFKLEGDDLRTFKREVTFSGVATPNLNVLYLWTERGANRHSKILDTDKAWEQFENLEETYFRVKQAGTYFKRPNIELLMYIGDAASYLRIQRNIMKDQGQPPEAIAMMDKIFCEQAGIELPKEFIRSNPNQLVLDDNGVPQLPEDISN